MNNLRLVGTITLTFSVIILNAVFLKSYNSLYFCTIKY